MENASSHFPKRQIVYGAIGSYNINIMDVNRDSKSSTIHRLIQIIAAVGLLSAMACLVSYKSEAIIVLSRWTTSESDASTRVLFEQFMLNHGKSYDLHEYSPKYIVFKQNLIEIERRNAVERSIGGSAIHGINAFSDLTQQEFQDQYLGLIPDSFISEINSPPPVQSEVPIERVYSNWANGYTTPLKIQSRCGACWAFVAVEQIESDCIRTLGFTSNTIKLSPQQLVDCVPSYTGHGCKGGWMGAAFKYLLTNGLQDESTYPYIGRDKNCSVDSSKYDIILRNYTEVRYNEEWMKRYVLMNGPLAIAINGRFLDSYQGGVLSYCGPPGSVTHGVQLVGINLKNPEEPYWIIRNSWGSHWGDGGYLYLRYGNNVCNVSYYAAFTEPVRYTSPLPS
eukprot:gene1087-2118_t